MTHRSLHPRDPGDSREDLEAVVRELERYADITAGDRAHGLADRVMASVAEEPAPTRGRLAAALGALGSAGPGPRAILVAATMALAALAVMLAGQLGALFGDPQIGPSPTSSVLATPTASPTPTATPSQTLPGPSATERSEATPSASPSSPAASPRPTAGETEDEHGDETPDPDETPEPADGDSSGPGGDDSPDEGDSGPG